MTLRAKTFILIAVVLVSLTLILYGAANLILLNSFTKLEEARTHQNIERSLNALADTLSVLNATTYDWAAWDDTYTFIADGNKNYIKKNLLDDTFNVLRLNLMLFVNNSGQIIFSKGFDLTDQEEIAISSAWSQLLSEEKILLHERDLDNYIEGIIVLPEAPMLIAARPILTSQDEGPIRGTLIMGRYLDATEIERIAHITRLPLAFYPVNDLPLTSDFQLARSALTQDSPTFIQPLNEETIAGYALIQNIFGEPALILKIESPREIYQQGQASLNYFLISVLVASLLFGGLIMLLLEKQVLTRLTNFTQKVSDISTSGDLSNRVSVQSQDELSRLGHSINTMLANLAHSQNALQESEVAEREQRLLAETLQEITLTLTSHINYTDVLDEILHQAKRLVPYNTANIMLLNSSGDALHVARWQGYETFDNQGFITNLIQPLAEYPLDAKAVQRRKPIIIHDTHQEPEWIILPETAWIRSNISAPIYLQNRALGLLRVDSDTVGKFTTKDAEYLMPLARAAAIALENARLYDQVQQELAERKRIEEEIRKLNEELEERVADRTRELSALYSVTTVASECLDLETVLERSLAEALAAMRSQVGAIHLLDETNGTLHLVTQQGIPVDTAADMGRWPSNSSLTGWVMEKAYPLVISDLTSDLRVSGSTDILDLQSYVGVPIRATGQVLGVLSVLGESRQQFNVEEVSLLASISDHIGVAVENVRLRQHAEQAAVMEERARLARELHDSVTQSLCSLVLLAGGGWRFVRAGNLENVETYLADIEDLAQQALKEMRLLVYELRPPILEQEGLIGAIQHRLDTVERRAGIEVRMEVEEMTDLPPLAAEELYRVVQEALSNTIKHAGASSVTVRISVTESEIDLEILDNGQGFNPQALQDSGGMGLNNMRERVEKLGGVLTIRSAPKEGTSVKINLTGNLEVSS